MRLKEGDQLNLDQSGLVEVILVTDARARVKSLVPKTNDFTVGDKQVHFTTYKEWDICSEVDETLKVNT